MLWIAVPLATSALAPIPQILQLDLVVVSEGYPLALIAVAAIALILLLRLLWRRLRRGSGG